MSKSDCHTPANLHENRTQCANLAKEGVECGQDTVSARLAALYASQLEALHDAIPAGDYHNHLRTVALELTLKRLEQDRESRELVYERTV
jgi:hypothetical protein